MKRFASKESPDSALRPVLQIVFTSAQAGPVAVPAPESALQQPTPTVTPEAAPTATPTSEPVATSTPEPVGTPSLWLAALSPAKDNTIFSGNQSRSNGAGQCFFAGRNASRGGGFVRRGLIAFDVAGNVPEGATIEEVRLKLRMSRTGAGAQDLTLHKLLADWGEGTSDASAEEGRVLPRQLVTPLGSIPSS